MMQKLIFSKNKLSGDIGLMVQMLNLNFVAVDVGAIFSIFRNDAKIIFSKNKLSGNIDLMVQMHNLNFVAAAVSNY